MLCPECGKAGRHNHTSSLEWEQWDCFHCKTRWEYNPFMDKLVIRARESLPSTAPTAKVME